MPWNILIFPLVAGYYNLTRCFLFKYKQQRLDRQRLIFDTILLGIVYFAISLLITSLLTNYFEFVVIKIRKLLPNNTPFLATSILSFVLSYTFTELFNLFAKDKNKYIEKAIIKVGNDLEWILKESNRKGKLISITLDNGKVYVGIVLELPIPSVSTYTKILPFYSGYRLENKNVEYNTQYVRVFHDLIEEGKANRIEELDVDLVIALKNIVSVSFFDQQLYKRFNPNYDEIKNPNPN